MTRVPSARAAAPHAARVVSSPGVVCRPSKNLIVLKSVREKDPNPSAGDPGNHAVDDAHLADAARDNPTKTLSGQQGVERRVQRRRGHVHRITTAGVGRGVHKVESWHTARASNGIGPWGRRKRRLAVMSGGLPQFGWRSMMRQSCA